MISILPQGRPLRRFIASCLTVAAALAFTTASRAQLAFKAFDETASVPVTTNPDGSVTITVAPGARTTLYSTNFVPVDFTSVTSGQIYVTANFKATAGLSNISGGTRAIGFGLYNNNATDPGTTFADDSGYFTWLNGRTTGSLIELRRRNGDGTSPSLLNPTGTAYVGLGTGTSVQTAGSLSDSGNYAIQLHLVRTATGVSLGTSSSTSATAGIWVSGDGGLSQTAYTNPDHPPAATLFNEVGFMFLNTAATPATLTLSLTGLTAVNPPSVATAPQNLSVNPGQSGSLFVVANGTAPLSYQWSKSGTPIAGATSSSYTLSSAQASDAGSYTVTITNAYGAVTSSAATITVTSSPIAPVLTTQPATLTVPAGTPATFMVTAYGSSPLTYQWQKNGAAITGATSSSYTISAPQPSDAGNYTVVLQNSAGTVTSSAAVLTVNTVPTITTQPTGVTTTVGQSVTFTVAATGIPAPTYQWLKNGVNISGATSATLAIPSVALTDAGVYTVRVVNAVGAVTSAAAPLIIPSPMSATGFNPSAGAGGVNIDTPLKITFDRPPTVGNTGKIRIYSSDGTLVDTLDFGSGPQTRKIGTNPIAYYYYPILVSGNTATIYPHAGILAYGQSYYVTIDPGVIGDGTGATFTGIAGTSTWSFTTKASGPAANATSVTVNLDGSGDFSTVQGAIDFVPLNNTQRVTITVKKGVYNEINYIGSAKPFITLQGEDRAQSIIAYSNNNNFNTLSGNNRAMFGCDASDFILQTITLHNTTPYLGSQAEAFRGNALRILLNRVNLMSFQDTFLVNGNNASAFVTDSYIEGDVDFMWGSGAVYFQRCELKALHAGYYTQIRNGAGQYGDVYVDCRLTAAPTLAAGASYLGRIDPTPGNFPYSQVIYLNCAIGPQVNPAGWLLNNASSSTTVQYWEYRSTDLNGATLDVSHRISSSRQLTDAEAALYRNPAVILAGWVPQLAPTIETGPVATTVGAGGVATLSIVANGSPEPTVQWYKNGVAIPGATGLTYTVGSAQSSDAANYSAVATSPLGSATSGAVFLTVGTGPYAGTYFGTAGSYNFALYVRNDGTGVYLATGPGRGAINRTVKVDSTGKFSFSTEGAGSVAVTGTISNGSVTGTAGTATLTGSLTSGGSSANSAGYYQTGVTGGSGTVSVIVGATGQALAVVQTAGGLDSGLGTAASGTASVTTAGGAAVSLAIPGSGASSTVTLTPSGGGTPLTLTGASDTTAGAQRLREFSTSARVDVNNPITIGFVVSGPMPDTVLIRGIGPSLGDEFSVAGALSNPRLDVYTNGSDMATNIGWINSTGVADIALTAPMVGAFPLRDNVADSALRLTLEPGNYSAVLSTANGTTTGIGLLEIYDVSMGSGGQRLTNFSSIGAAGTGSATLVAGISIGGTQPKRVLVRGVGPSLAAFGVVKPVSFPVISVYSGLTLVASNTNWNASVDAPNIAAAAAEVGAFALSATMPDSAVIVDLAPGIYTAQMTAADGVLGTGLIEIYELP